jgi:hypothetical protein
VSGPTPTTAAERFWSHVVRGPETNDRWVWTGAVGGDGYGRFWVPQPDGGQRATRPQRWLWEQLTGAPIPARVLLLHSCDIPLCVHVDLNPSSSHLAPGTHREKMEDRIRRRRNRSASATGG